MKGVLLINARQGEVAAARARRAKLRKDENYLGVETQVLSFGAISGRHGLLETRTLRCAQHVTRQFEHFGDVQSHMPWRIGERFFAARANNLTAGRIRCRQLDAKAGRFVSSNERTHPQTG